MKEYIEVDKEQAEKIMQDVYRYMPLITNINGKFARVVAQEGNKIYYTT